MSQVTESETNRNVEILKDAYARWNDSKAASESVEHWLSLIAEDVRWRSLADGSSGMEFTGECNCKAEVVQYFQVLGSQWELDHYNADEFIAQNDRVVMIGSCKWTHRQTGKTVETPKVDILRMKDGLIVDFYEFYDTAKALAGASGSFLDQTSLNQELEG